MPAWVTYAGGLNYPNNPDRQNLAIVRWHSPVTTAAERAEAREFFDAQSPALQAMCARIRANADGRNPGGAK